MVSRRLQSPAEVDQAIRGSEAEEVTLSPEVVAKIAGMAAREVEGVSLTAMPGLTAVLLGGAPSFGTRVRRAVRASLNGRRATLDLWLKVTYGPPIAKTVTDVRQTVRRRLQEMADVQDARINVHVTDMLLPTEDQQPAGED